MKKLLTILLTLLMVLSLSACGGKGNDKEEGGETDVEASAEILVDPLPPYGPGQVVTFTVKTEGFKNINSSSNVVVATKGEYDNYLTARENGRYMEKFATAEQDFVVDFADSDIERGDFIFLVFDGMSKDDAPIASYEFEVANDPVEYGQGYWEEKYPDANICPFYIEVAGVEYKYYYSSAYCDGTMESWVASPFNWNGWHIVNGAIVDADENVRFTDDWVGDDHSSNFSSFCTVTTQNYVPEEVNPIIPDIDTHEDGDDYIVDIDETSQLVITHKDNEIIGMSLIATYDSNALAEEALNEYNKSPDADVDSIKVEGNKLIAVYSPSVYADMSYSDAVYAFEMLKEMGGADLSTFLN